ncbi:MAG: CRTAC1 family protein, partial [Bacteroidota bacterium]
MCSNKAIITTVLTLSLWSALSAQTFREISQQIGLNTYCLDETIMGGGVAFFDYNQDYHPDIFVIGGERANVLLQKNWDGTFSNVSVQAGIELRDKYTMGVAVGDIDNDGDKDLFITTAKNQANVLLENQGDGTFVDISEKSGITDISWSTSATFGDFNRDGLIDIYVNNYAEFETFPFEQNIDRCSPNFLYQNLGDNQFVNVAEDLSVADVGCGLAVTFTDCDGDLDTDLYVANDFGLTYEANALYLNEYPNAFQKTARDIGMDYRINAMGIAIGDYDEDGDFDYYTTNIADNLLLESVNKSRFFREVAIQKEVGNPDGTSWGTAFLDYNHDTYLDLAVANGQVIQADFQNNENRLFQGNPERFFEDVSLAVGLADTTRSRGFSMGDYDLDGDLDFLFGVVSPTEQSNFQTLFYKNELEDQQNWIKVNLQGNLSNRDGYGSHLRIVLGDRSLIREADGGSSYLSHSSKEVHFGLGESTTIDSLIISWPSGQQDIYTNVESNQNLLAIESQQYFPYSHQEITIFEGDSIFLADAFQTTAGVYHHFTQNEEGEDVLYITRLSLAPKPIETFTEITFTASPNPFISSTQ